MTLHIHAPKGFYLGQIRRRYARKFQTVTRELTEANTALAIAVLRWDKSHSEARVIFCTHDGYYQPHVVMEAKR